MEHSDLSHGTYTFQSWKYVGGKGSHYEIRVQEEDLPLKIFIVCDKVNDDNLKKLRVGDKLDCYYLEEKRCFSLYEISHGDDMILSLNDSNKGRKDNVTCGYVAISILTAAFAGLTAYMFYYIYKDNKRLKLLEENS